MVGTAQAEREMNFMPWSVISHDLLPGGGESGNCRYWHVMGDDGRKVQLWAQTYFLTCRQKFLVQCPLFSVNFCHLRIRWSLTLWFYCSSRTMARRGMCTCIHTHTRVWIYILMFLYEYRGSPSNPVRASQLQEEPSKWDKRRKKTKEETALHLILPLLPLPEIQRDLRQSMFPHQWTNVLLPQMRY